MKSIIKYGVPGIRPPLSYPLASLSKKMLPSPTIDRLGQWSLVFYEATSTFTLVTNRIFARQPYADFVDGLQRITFPSSPAIQATWLWLLTMTGLSPVRMRYPLLGTLNNEDLTPWHIGIVLVSPSLPFLKFYPNWLWHDKRKNVLFQDLTPFITIYQLIPRLHQYRLILINDLMDFAYMPSIK